MENEGPLELVVFASDERTTRALPSEGRLTIGRAEDNDVRVDNSSVSRRHCVIHIGPKLTIEDLGGANGTFVRNPRERGHTQDTQDLRHVSGQTVEIQIGDRINVGSAIIVVRRAAASVTASEAPPSGDGFLLQDDAMRALYAQAERASRAPISVLILGETGVGKEVLAQHVHKSSPRGRGPFLGLNCAALSESLLESELFGHEKGSFTGATQARPGLFESAHGGTVFLDEVGELPMTMQVKLLRVLEERQVMRVGGRTPIPVDVRFVAATNRDLESAGKVGSFRQDLYFRLNGIALTIPPLRQRIADIEPLARLFLKRACKQMHRDDVTDIDAATIDALKRYAWPGNVRELRNVIERAAVLSAGPALRTEDLPSALLTTARAVVTSPEQEPRPDEAPTSESRPSVDGLRSELDALERQRIIEALKACAGNQTHAAERLGISRRTLVSRLAEYDIPRPRKRP